MTTPNNSKHPSRQELLRAATQGADAVKDHLADCDECRLLFELLSVYPVAGEVQLPDAPSSWVVRAEKIPGEKSLAGALRRLTAKITFDSWVLPAAVGVRSTSAIAERRIRCEAEAVSFDLRVERRGKKWECIAQLSSERHNLDSFHLTANNQTIVLNGDGYYQWLSSTPPQKLTLSSDEIVINLPEISWKPRSQS